MKNLLKDLLQFLDELKAYKEILTNPNSELLEAKRKNELFAAFPFLQDALPKKSREEVKEEVREKLVLKRGVLKDEIAKLTGRTDIDQFSRTWNRALSPVFGIGENKDALSLCIDYTLEAIGKLKSDIQMGIRDEQGKVIGDIQEISSEPPKAFIVHGGKSGVLEKLREFVEALGIKPLIVEMLPSKGMTVADKVKKYQQEADCAIILATRGGIIDTKSGKQHPRLNVIDELSSFWEAFPEKVIVLLEKGAELPSNKSGLTYEPFARQSMDRAFIAIARELTEMKILKAVKPKE